MSLSIIIPCLNEADGIAGTLEALQPLRGRGAEVIVVDGGSRDETLAIAQPLADAAFAAPRGRAAQMNAGAARARGQILLFLHADCLLPEAADGLIIDGLNRSRKSWGRFDVRIDSRHPVLRVVEALMNLRSRATGICTGDQCLFATRALFDTLGGYAELPLMEDIEFSRRARRRAWPIAIDARATTSGRRWEHHGVARTVLLMWRLRLAYFLGADPARLAADYRDAR